MKYRIDYTIRAFSLIELSIVILIIGILVAGVTQSSRLINQMRLISTKSLTQSSPINTIDDLSLWLDATTDSSFLDAEREDGSKISEWNDINIKKLQKIKLVQSDIVKKPIYTTNAINGLPAIRFDDNPAAQVRTIVYPSAMSGDFIPYNQATVFMVILIDQISYVSTFLWEVNGSRFLTHTIWPDNNIYFDFGFCCDSTARLPAAINPAIYTKTPKFMTYIKAPTSLTIRSNGSVIGSASGANSSIPAGKVGDFSLGLGLNGKIGEFVFFSRALKNEEILAIEDYLSKKWSIK